MNNSICENCFHYAACMDIDITGSVGNPECNPENENCMHFISKDSIKIQPRAYWVEKIREYSDGDITLTYRCCCCNNLEKVKIYKPAEWNNYFSKHYREELDLPIYCKNCGSIVMDIVCDK